MDYATFVQIQSGQQAGGQLGNSPPPKFSKTCLVVRYNKLQSFCPPKISASCGPGSNAFSFVVAGFGICTHSVKTANFRITHVYAGLARVDV